MDKPISMSVKEYICRLMSIKMNIPLKTVETIVDHQFQSANEALKTNYSLEISGFGKFLFNHKKAEKKWEKNLSKKATFERMLLNPDITEQKRKSLELKLENTIKWLDHIKPKLETDEHRAIVGRVEEQVAPSEGLKGSDRTDLPSEDGNMQGLPVVFGEQEEVNRLDN